MSTRGSGRRGGRSARGGQGGAGGHRLAHAALRQAVDQSAPAEPPTGIMRRLGDANGSREDLRGGPGASKRRQIGADGRASPAGSSPSHAHGKRRYSPYGAASSTLTSDDAACTVVVSLPADAAEISLDELQQWLLLKTRLERFRRVAQLAPNRLQIVAVDARDVPALLQLDNFANADGVEPDNRARAFGVLQFSEQFLGDAASVATVPQHAPGNQRRKCGQQQSVNGIKHPVHDRIHSAW